MSDVCVVLMRCRIFAPMLAVELDSYFRDSTLNASLEDVDSRIKFRFRLSTYITKGIFVLVFPSADDIFDVPGFIFLRVGGALVLSVHNVS